MTKQSADGSAADHAYFQALEDAFIRLRGAPLLLSPADWQVAKGWRRAGIPLELVVGVMERIFERQAEAGGRTGIRGLRYFRTAVEGSWRRIRELGGGEPPDLEGPPLDVSACLGRLAAALPEASAGGGGSLRGALSEALEGVREKLSSLEGSTRQVEAELQRLDRQVMDRLRDGLDEEVLASLERSVQESLSALSPRLRGDVRDQTAEILLRRRLREELGLPVLSLFSPEASGAA